MYSIGDLSVLNPSIIQNISFFLIHPVINNKITYKVNEAKSSYPNMKGKLTGAWIGVQEMKHTYLSRFLGHGFGKHFVCKEKKKTMYFF